MLKIAILGAGSMGTAFSVPCSDNGHQINIIGTHLEDKFIENIRNNSNYHPSLGVSVSSKINFCKNHEINSVLIQNLNLIVLAVTSKGIEWAANELSKIYKNKKIPSIVLLTKGLSLHENNYEILVDKLSRLLNEQNVKGVNVSAIGGPCLAKGLANKIHTSVVLANKDIQHVKELSKIFSTDYYHISHSNDIIGVEVCAAIKNIYSMAIGASNGLCSETADEKIRLNNYLNTSASLVNQSIQEMQFFVNFLKGKKETVMGLAGVGDLYVSADGGRNSKMGTYLGQGLTYKEAKETKMSKITVEGAELIFEVGKKILSNSSVKELPLMIAIIDSVLNNKKLTINWKNFK
jgi:glycerol-3-phosphate dehydrogenase (NAD(P)+)